MVIRLYEVGTAAPGRDALLAQILGVVFPHQDTFTFTFTYQDSKESGDAWMMAITALANQKLKGPY